MLPNTALKPISDTGVHLITGVHPNTGVQPFIPVKLTSDTTVRTNAGVPPSSLVIT